MSDNWLRYVPNDPHFRPTASAAAAAEDFLRNIFPSAQEIRSEFFEKVTFIDPAGNWSGVHCSVCNADAEPWWGAAMSAAAEQDFASLSVKAPCCGAALSLNDLRYGWPAAFSCFVVEAMNPKSKGTSELERARLATALGCGVREIPVHL
jgi:hypothetical protein